MATFKLQSKSGEHSVDIVPGQTVVIGRAVTTDLPIYDPTVSRRHAELVHTNDGVTVRDLGSSNGTFVNGNRVTETSLSDGDAVTFGKVAFKLTELVEADSPPHAEAFASPQAAPEATIVRQLPVSDSDSLEQHVARLSGEVDPSSLSGYLRSLYPWPSGHFGARTEDLFSDDCGGRRQSRKIPLVYGRGAHGDYP